MLHYILQVMVFQLVFLLIFDLFLKKETFFNWNRAYLMLTAIFSLVLPFLKFNSLAAFRQDPFVVKLPAIIIGEAQTTLDPIVANYAGITIEPESMAVWKILLFVGMGIMVFFFLIKVSRLYVLYQKNPKQREGELLIVNLFNSSTAFSFFHYVFMGEGIPKRDRTCILEHETVHVKQLHTLDLLFFELLRIVFWFNPFAYMYQSRVATLHEYIADSKALKFQNKKTYYNQLLSQVFDTRQFSFVNPFFKKSLVKKRIVMLSKAKSRQRNSLKYALLLPLIAGMLFYVSCHKESLGNEDPSAFDLSQYSYSMEKGSNVMTKETKIIYEAYENFLRSHPNYVSWARIDDNRNIVSYSVHPIEEPVPETWNKLEVSSKQNGSYLMYMDLDSSENIITETEEIEVIESDRIEVPFSIIEIVPTIEECAKNFKSNAERKKCTSDFIAKHVNKNFNTQLATQLGLNGRQRINVIFKIDTRGNVVNVRSRAPHPGLEEEAIRVINTLPTFIPGKQKGKAVTVPYSLPILFQVNGTAENSEETAQANDEADVMKNVAQDIGLTEIPFSVVEVAPKFKDCTMTSNSDAKKCTSQSVSDFVNENFNIKLAKQNGLVGRQRINVIFKIDQQGNVINIRARASSPVLEQEARRVIGNLPKFTPGTYRGRAVVVPYSLPILFDVQ